MNDWKDDFTFLLIVVIVFGIAWIYGPSRPPAPLIGPVWPVSAR